MLSAALSVDVGINRMYTEYLLLALWIVVGGVGFSIGLVGLSATKRRMAGAASAAADRTSINQDKTSMAANLEVRVPFLNHELMELAGRMPVNLKLRGLKRKYILKRAAEKLLPKEIVWRKKAGFGAPIRSWLRGPLKPMIDDLLSEETIKRRGLFQASAVQRIINANQSGQEDFNLQVFQLLTLELWQRTFLDSTTL